jgi:hypothetical protein
MIPASLIVVLTITMAAGMKIIVKRHVVVRKLDSLEALGGVTGESQTFHITSHLLTFFRHLFKQNWPVDTGQNGG